MLSEEQKNCKKAVGIIKTLQTIAKLHLTMSEQPDNNIYIKISKTLLPFFLNRLSFITEIISSLGNKQKNTTLRNRTKTFYTSERCIICHYRR